MMGREIDRLAERASRKDCPACHNYWRAIGFAWNDLISYVKKVRRRNDPSKETKEKLVALKTELTRRREDALQHIQHEHPEELE